MDRKINSKEINKEPLFLALVTLAHIYIPHAQHLLTFPQHLWKILILILTYPEQQLLRNRRETRRLVDKYVRLKISRFGGCCQAGRRCAACLRLHVPPRYSVLFRQSARSISAVPAITSSSSLASNTDTRRTSTTYHTQTGWLSGSELPLNRTSNRK